MVSEHNSEYYCFFRFLDFIEKWVKQNEKRFNMSVAYMAERSIEDELDRTSQSDVLTIVISYLIMFAYIAVALGQIRSCSRILVILLSKAEDSCC
jgi:Niemann-Pick C1 protein